ncbi:hypothetical protein Tco_1278673, partial [Tanacetum coccineum]
LFSLAVRSRCRVGFVAKWVSLLLHFLGLLLCGFDNFASLCICADRIFCWPSKLLGAASPQVSSPRHFRGGAQAITKHTLLSDLVMFERTELTLKRMGLWLCGPPVPCCSQPDLVKGLVPVEHDGFTLSLLDSLFSKGLRTVKSIPPKCRLGFSQVLKGALDKVICKPDDISSWVSLLVLPLCLLKTFCPRSNLECKYANKRQYQEESITNAILSWGVPGGCLQLMRETLAEFASPMLDLVEEDLDLNERNIKQCKRKICDGHYTVVVRVLSSSGVAPYNDDTF